MGGGVQFVSNVDQLNGKAEGIAAKHSPDMPLPPKHSGGLGGGGPGGGEPSGGARGSSIWTKP